MKQSQQNLHNLPFGAKGKILVLLHYSPSDSQYKNGTFHLAFTNKQGDTQLEKEGLAMLFSIMYLISDSICYLKKHNKNIAILFLHHQHLYCALSNKWLKENLKIT